MAAAKKILLPIVVEMDDGQKHRAEVRLPPSYQDQAAFEQQFGQSAVALDVAVREMGKAATDDPTFQGALAMRARWFVFFAWRQLRREHVGIPPFPVFEEQIGEVTVEDVRILDDGESVDPTDRAAAAGPEASPGS